MREWLNNGGPKNAAVLIARASTPALLAYVAAQIGMMNGKLDLLLNLLLKGK